MPVTPSRDPIFSPPIRSLMCLFKGEKIPRIAIGTVIFPHRTPRSFRNIRTPLVPKRDRPISFFFQPLMFGVHPPSYSASKFLTQSDFLDRVCVIKQFYSMIKFFLAHRASEANSNRFDRRRP